jgi:membrane associated rhomboid family serine protease
VVFQDRPYYREQPSNGPGGGQLRFGLPRLTPMVKYLLIVNCAVFILQVIMRGRLEYYFAAAGLPPVVALQFWRLLTFQFLHSVDDPFHILLNMVGLYFLGPVLERNWGWKKFLSFYLICGAVGGTLYVVASRLQWMGEGYLIGASGGVLALLVACAILFPQFRVILLIFPVPIRTAAVLLTIGYLLFVLTGSRNAGGHLCHLGGMATGFVWVMAQPYFALLQQKRNKYAQQHNQEQNEKLNYELDRILAKVHEQGIQSLSRSEKQFLQKATQQHKHK